MWLVRMQTDDKTKTRSPPIGMQGKRRATKIQLKAVSSGILAVFKQNAKAFSLNAIVNVCLRLRHEMIPFEYLGNY